MVAAQGSKITLWSTKPVCDAFTTEILEIGLANAVCIGQADFEHDCSATWIQVLFIPMSPMSIALLHEFSNIFPDILLSRPHRQSHIFSAR